MEKTSAVIIALISGIVGAIASLLTYRKDSVKLVIATLQEENKYLNTQLKELQLQINSFQNKIRKQELHLIALESTNYGHPWPSWIKDTDGRYIMINKAFEDIFLKCNNMNRYDFIGKTDAEINIFETTEKTTEKDYRVLSTKESFESLDTILIRNFDKHEIVWTIRYPLMVNNTVVGIGGSCVPVDNIIKAMNILKS